jgi:hypothetical protein
MNMADVISFPVGQRLADHGVRAVPAETGVVIILPVIRIERDPDEPSDGMEPAGASTGRRRRRRAAR